MVQVMRQEQDIPGFGLQLGNQAVHVIEIDRQFLRDGFILWTCCFHRSKPLRFVSDGFMSTFLGGQADVMPRLTWSTAIIGLQRTYAGYQIIDRCAPHEVRTLE